MTVNGMIADKDGSEDFLSHDNWIMFSKLANKIGNNVWGRKTYEAVKSWPPEFIAEIKNITKVVISKDYTSKDTDLIFVPSPKSAIDYLTKKGFKEMLVTGGQSVYSSFLRDGLVDEIIFDVEPALIGNGIKAFSFYGNPIKLKLIDFQKINDKLLELHYKVLR